jgi:RNA polymerase sigma-70 factor (ECF subfamily)
MKRSSGNTRVDIDLSELNVADDFDMEQSFINSDLKKYITALTQGLTPKQRLVFTLCDIEDLELDEVVNITGLSRAKIKSNLYLARQHIREKL